MSAKNEHIFTKETVGSLMTQEYIKLSERFTVDQAIGYVRKNVKNKKNIYYLNCNIKLAT